MDDQLTEATEMVFDSVGKLMIAVDDSLRTGDRTALRGQLMADRLLDLRASYLTYLYVRDHREDDDA